MLHLKPTERRVRFACRALQWLARFDRLWVGLLSFGLVDHEAYCPICRQRVEIDNVSNHMWYFHFRQLAEEADQWKSPNSKAS